MRDRNHRAAIAYIEEQKDAASDALRLVFSDYVFDETAMALAVRSRRHDLASAAGRAILESKNLRLVRVELPAFEAAWKLFVRRSRTNDGPSRTAPPSSSWRTSAFARPSRSTRTSGRPGSRPFRRPVLVLGTKTFAKSADVAGTARYRVTSRGNRIAESPKGEELAIEEIV